MSESPTNSGSETFVGPFKVLPRHVNDPSILDSFAGFINDVVPASHTSPHDTKDQIQWAKFEELEEDYASLIPSTLVLVLGYTTGIQVWAIPANGEATEILGWKHSYVKVLKFLPVPYLVSNVSKKDIFSPKRPLLAICDSSSSGPQFSSLNFVSLKTGEQVKVIKFKNSLLDVVANKQSIVVTFQEKIAVFDAFTLEDNITVTTCYLSPGLNPNPITLGAKWLAYAEKKLNLSKRSSGGMDGEGVQSYTATVIHAAKSLGRGLRELTETVTNSLTGSNNFKPGTSPNSPQAGGQSDIPHKGVVTILDIGSPYVQSQDKSSLTGDPVIAHFNAHTEAVVALQFDPSGMLLLTADKRGHDFHLFRIHPHPGGSTLATIHHLYILHRGDTSAKVQDMCFSPDSRWASVSTLRGTSHVFPITPYGGNVGMRTHATSHVVNKMSRFHRSAGLTVDGRSNSPISMLEMPSTSNFPYHNPRLPPFPHPTVVNPLAQIRQPLLVPNAGNIPPTKQQTGRQRIPSSSEENVCLRLVTCFAAPRALLDITRDASMLKQTKSVNSLFIMSCHGTLIQYDLEPHQMSNIPKERVSSDTPIELTVSAPIALLDITHDASMLKQTKSVNSLFIMSCHGTLIKYDLEPHQMSNIPKERVSSDTPIELTVSGKAQWLFHRRHGSPDLVPPMTKDNLAYIKREEKPLNVKTEKSDYSDEHWLSQVEIITHAGPHRRLWMGPQFTFKTYKTIAGSPLSVGEAQPIDLGHTKPINMPITKANAVLIESSSASSFEQHLLENYKTLEEGGGIGELQLKEDLADAMLESPGIRDTGGRCVIVQMKPAVAKVVNPLGTVVNVHSDEEIDVEVFEEDIHENCDETLFRPIMVPKVVVNHDKVQYGDTILTKSLESTTEVAVKILKKSTDEKQEIKMTTIEPKHKKNKNKIVANVKVDPIFDLFESKPLPKISSEPKIATEFEKIKPPIPLEKLNIDFEESNKKILDFPPLDNDNFFSLENLSKDNFEDASEEVSRDDIKKSKTKTEKTNLQHLSETNSSEENIIEEKVVSRRNRKPKSKLGIKILNPSNDSEITLPVPQKKSWSNIAASKPKQKSIINYTEDDKDFDLSKIEFVEEEFTIQLPKKSNLVSNISDFININDTEEEKGDTDTDRDIFSIPIPEDSALFKTHKCSDEEKGELSSSPADATESDDSGKILSNTVLKETKVTTSAKSCKKKKKKK